MTTTTITKPARSHEELLRASVNYDEQESGEMDWELARMALVRKLNSLAELPLECRDRRCRCTRQCVGPTMRCLRDSPPPPDTAENDEMLAEFRKGLAAHMRARGMR
jgi:hypothetical protein